MGGVGRVIAQRESACGQHAAISLQVGFPSLQPSAGHDECASAERDEAEFAPVAEVRQVGLPHEIAEEDDAGEQDDDADAHQPVGAEAPFHGVAGLRGHCRLRLR